MEEKKMRVFMKNRISWAIKILLWHVVYVSKSSHNFEVKGKHTLSSNSFLYPNFDIFNIFYGIFVPKCQIYCFWLSSDIVLASKNLRVYIDIYPYKFLRYLPAVGVNILQKDWYLFPVGFGKLYPKSGRDTKQLTQN